MTTATAFKPIQQEVAQVARVEVPATTYEEQARKAIDRRNKENGPGHRGRSSSYSCCLS